MTEKEKKQWEMLLSTTRLRESSFKNKSELDARTEFENDYDRVVFSSAFRRLKNKAQVFSLEGNDFVRTRLTHSLEVSTIGRSLGEGVAKILKLDEREVGSLVATVCLLHDIGNPPFGHSGEDAMCAWFKKKVTCGKDAKNGLKLSDSQEINDLLQFEGNAQGFRIATRLQWSGFDFGMNLTAATLAVLIKYPVSSEEAHSRVKNGKSDKLRCKFGYMKADEIAFKKVRQLVGLTGDRRHPLTFLVEAADDIAYLTGDLEDVLKKGLIGYDALKKKLLDETEGASKTLVERFLIKGESDLSEMVSDPKELQQLAVQNFTRMASKLMTKSCIKLFVDEHSSILAGDIQSPLLSKMDLSDLGFCLRKIVKLNVFPHLEVLSREQTSRKVIHGLMDIVYEELTERPGDALAEMVYKTARLSPGDRNEWTGDYQLCLRIADYISGMTDDFAFEQFQRIHGMGRRL